MSDRGERIRSARLAAGLSQAELARRAGTSQPAVNRYEQGRVVPAVGTAVRLVAAYQARMRPSELLANNRARVWRLAAESDLDLLVEIPPERLRLFASSGSSAKPSTG
jgi:transcriptional regulator with XRE-family HTH domain